MGRRPVTPRSPGRSLGAIGRTTLADSTVGGGHDDLIRRTLQQGGTEWAGRAGGRVRAWASDEIPITGAGIFGVNEFLVDEKWDVDQPCMVTATMTWTASGWSHVQDQPANAYAPATYHRAPLSLLQLTDGDDDRVTLPGEHYEAAQKTWLVNIGTGAEPYPNYTGTVSWMFERGRPKVSGGVIVSSAAAPGLSGSPKLLVIARVTRL